LVSKFFETYFKKFLKCFGPWNFKHLFISIPKSIEFNSKIKHIYEQITFFSQYIANLAGNSNKRGGGRLLIQPLAIPVGY